MFFEKSAAARERPFGCNASGNVVAVQPMAVEGVRVVDNLISLKESDRDVDIFPDGELFIISADRIKACSAKQRS